MIVLVMVRSLFFRLKKVHTEWLSTVRRGINGLCEIIENKISNESCVEYREEVLFTNYTEFFSRNAL